jgi:hypothetical protein
MGKIIFLIGLVTSLLFLNSSYGQTKNDSIEAYKKVNKWAVVKLTIAYMEDLRNWSSITKKEGLETNLKNEFDDYLKLVKDYKEYTEFIELDSFSVSLNDNWRGTKKAVFEKYKIEFCDSISKYNFENVGFIPEKTTNTQNRLNALKLIQAKYNSFLPKIENDDIFAELANTSLQINRNTSDNVKKRKTSFSSIIIYLLLTVSVFLNILLFGRFIPLRKNKLKDNSKSKDSLEKWNLDLQDSIRVLKEKNKQLQENITTKERTIISNEYQFRDVKIEQKTDNEIIIKDQPSLTVNLNVTKIEETKKNLIYLPSPFEERKFANEDASEIEKSTSLYLAIVDGNSNKGTITLIESADLSRALNSPNIYLETVCEYENAYNSEAKGIKVITDGEVVLEGQDWVVKSKIKIKFI